MARPRKPVKPEDLIKLAQMYCSVENMAYYFDCSVDTIQLRVREYFDMTFEEFFKHHRMNSLLGIKQKLWQKALKGDNVCMLNLLKAYDPDFKGAAAEKESTVYILNKVFLPDQVRRIATAALEEADYIEAESLKEISNGTIEPNAGTDSQPSDSVLDSDLEEIRTIPPPPIDS